MDENDKKVAEAKKEARRAQIMSWIWWAIMPIVCGIYWFVSKEPPIEKMILVFLAAVSIVANAVTYSGKAKASEAKVAGYENP